MMHTVRWMAAGLGLAALLAGGCVLTSAQILVHFDLPNPMVVSNSGNPVETVPVDLNTIDDYEDHKEKLKNLNDLALLGTFRNVSGPAGGLSVYIRPSYDAAPVAALPVDAVLLWGPATIGASGSVVQIDWNDSAALFNAAGKQILIDQAKGDGRFTLYAVGTAGTYNLEVRHGKLVLVIDAGI